MYLYKASRSRDEINNGVEPKSKRRMKESRTR